MKGASSPPYRVLVVEDEAPARATMKELVGADPELEWVGETWGEESVKGIRRLAPDLVLLDIQMPGMDGFQVLDALEPEARPLVVFVTAYDEHAVEAFEVRALDYVLKPFTDARLRKALERAKERLSAGMIGPQPLPSLAPEPRGRETGAASGGEGTRVGRILRDRLVLKEGGRSLVLPRNRILWIEASGQYVVVHMDQGKDHLVRAALKDLDEDLGEAGFYRVHRSALVNLESVRELRPLSHGDALVALSDGTEVKLSRSRREGFEEILLKGEDS